MTFGRLPDIIKSLIVTMISTIQGLEEKVMKKLYLTVVMAAFMSLSSAGIAFAGQWIQDGSGWKYQKDDTAFHVGGWQWVDNKCYYFTPEGYCLLNTTTPDGFTVDSSGAWIVNGVIQVQQTDAQEGWNQLGDVWKYYANKKYVTSSWKSVDGKRYYFDESGNMVTGFRDVDGEKYYFNADGSLATTSFTLDGMRYIVGANGVIKDETDEFDWFSGNYSSNNDSSNNDSSDNYDSEYDSSSDKSSYAKRVFEIVNENRRAYDVEELEWDDVLASCAQERAYELRDRFSHTRPDDSKWSTILSETGVSYRSAGENIASGQTSAKAVMTSWMKSTGHKNNILNTSFGRMGVGCVYIDGNYYWVQIFTD